MEPEDTLPTKAPEQDAKATAAASGASQTPAATGQDDQKPSLESLPKYWQEHIRDLRNENKQKRELAQKAENDRKAQEEADLAAKQEWEKLATKRQQEIDQLKPKAEEASQLSELLTAQINKEIEKWPEEVKATAPDEEVSALEFVKWLDKMRPLAQKLMEGSSGSTPAAPVAPGNGPNPVPKTSAAGRPEKLGREDVLVDVDRRF